MKVLAIILVYTLTIHSISSSTITSITDIPDRYPPSSLHNALSRHTLLWVDFDVSFGQGRPYFHQFYQDLIHTITHYKQTNIALSPAIVHNLFVLCKTLYKNNTPYKLGISPYPKIPLKIHQIWLGSPLPEKYKKWQKTWQTMGSGWEYKLWTDADVKDLKLINQKLYNLETNPGAKSDILRIEILYRYGGIYIDTDFECINPEAFRKLHHLYDFYAGFHSADFKVFCLVNGLIGARPGHPILKGYIDELAAQYPFTNSIILRTGPAFFTRMFLKYANKGFKDIAFGPSYFYPASLMQLQNMKHQSQQAIKSQVLFPETVAFHWWEGSWWGQK